MAEVEVVHWNPVRPIVSAPYSSLIRVTRPVGNFGDLLGPVIVDRMLASRGIADGIADGAAPRSARLLAVGSILQYARTGDIVWGSGINGKIPADAHDFASLDVRAVRGPKTRDVLAGRGIDAPEVYGDPALLLADLDPRLREWAAEPRHEVTVVPNLHDLGRMRFRRAVQSPKAAVDTVLRRIAQSRLVVGSSLHGIVIAESLGIPARLVRSAHENTFKYDDYYAATGRPTSTPAHDVRSAVEARGEPPIEWDPAPLKAAFPWDLWHRDPSPGTTADRIQGEAQR